MEENKITHGDIVRKVKQRFKRKGIQALENVNVPLGDREVDIVAIGKNDIYVCECKVGEVLRPSKGLGQLLFYKGAIERKFGKFLSTLRRESKREEIPLRVKYQLCLSKPKTSDGKKAREILRSQLIPQVSIVPVDCQN